MTGRVDVIPFSGDAALVEAKLGNAPGVVMLIGANLLNREVRTLRFPNTGRVRVSEFGATVNSDLSDAEHNAWAVEVFDAVCEAVDGDVELLDEKDHALRSRRRRSVGSL